MGVFCSIEPTDFPKKTQLDQNLDYFVQLWRIGLIVIIGPNFFEAEKTFFSDSKMFRFFFRGESNFSFWVNEVDERPKKVDLEGQKRKIGTVEVEVDHNKAIQKFLY